MQWKRRRARNLYIFQKQPVHDVVPRRKQSYGRRSRSYCLYVYKNGKFNFDLPVLHKRCAPWVLHRCLSYCALVSGGDLSKLWRQKQKLDRFVETYGADPGQVLERWSRHRRAKTVEACIVPGELSIQQYMIGLNYIVCSGTSEACLFDGAVGISKKWGRIVTSKIEALERELEQRSASTAESLKALDELLLLMAGLRIEECSNKCSCNVHSDVSQELRARAVYEMSNTNISFFP